MEPSNAPTNRQAAPASGEAEADPNTVTAGEGVVEVIEEVLREGADPQALATAGAAAAAAAAGRQLAASPQAASVLSYLPPEAEAIIELLLDQAEGQGGRHAGHAQTQLSEMRDKGQAKLEEAETRLAELKAKGQAAVEEVMHDPEAAIERLAELLTPAQRETLAQAAVMMETVGGSADGDTAVQLFSAFLPDGKLKTFIQVSTVEQRRALFARVKRVGSTAAHVVREDKAEENKDKSGVERMQGRITAMGSAVQSFSALIGMRESNRSRPQLFAEVASNTLPAQTRMRMANGIKALSDAHLKGEVVVLVLGLAFFITLLVIGAVKVSAVCNYAMAPLNIAFGSAGLVTNFILGVMAYQQRQVVLRFVAAVHAALKIEPCTSKAEKGQPIVESPADDGDDAEDPEVVGTEWTNLQSRKGQVIGLASVASLGFMIAGAVMTFNSSPTLCDATLYNWTFAWVIAYLCAIGMACCFACCALMCGMTIVGAMIASHPR